MRETSHETAEELLGRIDSPADLKELSRGELPRVCEAIRAFLEKAMAGTSERVFGEVWRITEGSRLVLYWQCAVPGAAPAPPGELYHGMSTLCYAGDGLFSEQMDIYDREQARGSRRRAGEPGIPAASG